jgi:RNA polymerase sigma-70 factor, ECF subfamily
MMLSNETDTEVFQALRSGNLSALSIFYERYGEIVYRVALRMLKNAQEAEDLTQEVFLTLWRSQTYDSKRGSMQVFLTTLTRSKAIDRLRQIQARSQRLQKWSRNFFPENRNTLMDKASNQELSHRIREALSELPSQQRQVLEMAYYDGLSQSEISQDLKMPLGTVKTYKRKALLKLRQMLQDLVE